MGHSRISIALLGAALVAALFAACGDDTNDNAPDKQSGPLRDFKDTASAAAIYAREGRDSAALARQGGVLAHEVRSGYSCVSCHAMPGSQTVIGPTLYGTAARYTDALGDAARARVWLHNHIADPRSTPGLATAAYAANTMPAFKSIFQPGEIEAMVEYIMSLPAKP